MFIIRKAERKKSKLRAALIGVSWVGKTYSSLLIATGMGGKICIIDTEKSSDDYANEFNYDVIELAAPFEPLRYVEAIKDAEKSGYNVIIIDSLSHAWNGEGGFLDLTDRFAKTSSNKNSWAAFKETTPMQNKLINSIIQSTSHIIVTMRSKIHYDLQDDGKGRKIPVKLGMAPIQREGIEYEFTLLLELQQNHYAIPTKDRTGIFKDPFIPTVESGEKILEWLNTGKDEEDIRKEAIKEMAHKFYMDMESISDITVLRDFYRNAQRELCSFPEGKQYVEELANRAKDKADQLNQQTGEHENAQTN